MNEHIRNTILEKFENPDFPKWIMNNFNITVKEEIKQPLK
jgi:hypothetical protein